MRITVPKFNRKRPGVVALLDLARTAPTLAEAARFQRMAADASKLA